MVSCFCIMTHQAQSLNGSVCFPFSVDLFSVGSQNILHECKVYSSPYIRVIRLCFMFMTKFMQYSLQLKSTKVAVGKQKI